MSPRASKPPAVRPERIVVLGTGTGVGKTWLTRSLAEALHREGADVVALKPIETGVATPVSPAPNDPRSTIRSVDPASRNDRSDWALLAGASTIRVLPPPFTFEDPVSPHLAARRAGRPIEIAKVAEYVIAHERAVTSHVTSFSLVESAGGCLSPLAVGVANVDLAFALEPATWILVAPDALGVLHDVSATLGVLAARRRLPDHLVLSAAREPDASTGTNAAELHALGIVTPSLTIPRGDTRALDAFAKALVARARSATSR
jgi:dethiobiotin synthetase